jgi:hypothetical protein
MIVSEIYRVTSTDIGDRRHLNSCERGTNIESQLQHINLAHLLIMRSIARPKRSLKLSQRKSLEHSCTSGSYVASGESLAANLTVHIKNPHGFSQRDVTSRVVSTRQSTTPPPIDCAITTASTTFTTTASSPAPLIHAPKYKNPLGSVQSLRTHMAGMHGTSAEATSKWIEMAKWWKTNMIRHGIDRSL